MTQPVEDHECARGLADDLCGDAQERAATKDAMLRSASTSSHDAPSRITAAAAEKRPHPHGACRSGSAYDYCAACGRDLCPDCMARGCCGAAPARSGTQAHWGEDALTKIADGDA